jgi:hypothetical protein
MQEDEILGLPSLNHHAPTSTGCISVKSRPSYASHRLDSSAHYRRAGSWQPLHTKLQWPRYLTPGTAMKHSCQLVT